jgi:hypothetical protein
VDNDKMGVELGDIYYIKSDVTDNSRNLFEVVEELDDDKYLLHISKLCWLSTYNPRLHLVRCVGKVIVTKEELKEDYFLVAVSNSGNRLKDKEANH